MNAWASRRARDVAMHDGSAPCAMAAPAAYQQRTNLSAMAVGPAGNLARSGVSPGHHLVVLWSTADCDPRVAFLRDFVFDSGGLKGVFDWIRKVLVLNEAADTQTLW